MKARFAKRLLVLAVVLLGSIASCTSILGVDTDYAANPCSAGELPPLQCGVGECLVFVEACTNGLPNECVPGTAKEQETCKDGIDNTCNGSIDEGCECKTGETQPCYRGSPSQLAHGLCKRGVQTCMNGQWSECAGDELPTQEICDELDNDCDGEIDEGCPCVEGQQQKCYDGPTVTRNVGACKDGKQTCDANGKWSDCVSDVVPGLEICNGYDDDCDTRIDPPPQCECVDQQTYDCYDGPVDTKGVGACHGGKATCKAGTLGPCEGEVTPQNESCNNIDDDCDGVDDTKDDDIDQNQPCNTGKPGPCAAGLTQCTAKGEIECITSHTLKAETCNGEDDDCDGTVDQILGLDLKLHPIVDTPPDCAVPNLQGDCGKGNNVCGADGKFQCVQVNFPGVETCAVGDEDCDGNVNNGNLCCPNNVKDGSESDIDCGGACADGVNVQEPGKTGPILKCAVGSPGTELEFAL